ncbi:MAG TPA: efflux transporter outer membrane subunit [Rhodocyclaceae bacterium]|nr:efflux transporter outer membrane subunit [Rhodocyclaceae bacterium]
MKPTIRHPLAAAGHALLVFSTLIAGCAVGPDFHRPEAPDAQGYTVAPLRPQTAADAPGGAAQRFVSGQDVSARWWQAFQSPPLDALIDRALKASPNIDAARATLAQAQELVYAQRGFFFPNAQIGYSPSRTKASGNTAGANAPGIQGDGTVIGPSAPAAPVLYNFHTAQLTVGFVPDVLGGNRRAVESLQAQADAQGFALEAARVTLATNLTAAAIQEASLRAQLDAVKRMVAINTRGLEILKRQQQAGYASGLDVATQETALAQAEQALPPLTRQLEQTRDLIRVLAGNRPDQDVAETFTLASLHLPETLPLSLPSQLVQQRPDVRAAEAQLHAATASVGVAIANRLPQLSLTATMGGEAAHLDQMFKDSGKFFSVVGNIAMPLFDGGTLRHRQYAAEEGVNLAGAQYRATVLTAFQNVADTLHALNADAESFAAASRTEKASHRAFDLTRKQHEAGYVNSLALFSAEQNYLQASLTLIQARAGRLGDTAALFQALGGGWWNGQDKMAASDTAEH